MQQRTIINKGKKYLVNVAAEDEGVGAGFPIGQLTLKSLSDKFWYLVTASGSAGNVKVFVSQSALAIPTASIYTNESPYDTGVIHQVVGACFYDQNFPYQLLRSSDNNTYQVFLTGSAPNAGVVISQSMYCTGSYITNSLHAIIDTAKPNLLLFNITDGNYYVASLVTSASVTTMSVSQTVISASWIDQIF